MSQRVICGKYTIGGFNVSQLLFRFTDPETSRLGAEGVVGKLVGYRANFIERLKELGQATANEVAAGNESIRKRARECERMGLIRECGVRACSVTGKQAIVWEVSGGSSNT